MAVRPWPIDRPASRAESAICTQPRGMTELLSPTWLVPFAGVRKAWDDIVAEVAGWHPFPSVKGCGMRCGVCRSLLGTQVRDDVPVAAADPYVELAVGVPEY